MFSRNYGSMPQLVNHLRAMGIVKSDRVASVLRQVDRVDFAPTEPYLDGPVEIGHEATISAPHMHAYVLEEAQEMLIPGARVLDVGCGSGYLTVAMGLMIGSGKVVGIDHIPELIELSNANMHKHHSNLSSIVEFVCGDGREGWPQVAPYNFIHVGAASKNVPKPLIEQLAPNGMLIIPVGELFQTIRIIRKDSHGDLSQEETLDVRYVPLK